MTLGVTDDSNYTNIANAIRAMSAGDTEGLTLTPSEMASAIRGLKSVWGNIEGTLSNQTDIQTALNQKAPLASPTFTGIPKAPTAPDGTNNTQIATTEFVNNAFRTNEAMVYKGTIGGSGADVNALPTTHYRGWAYKVATAGTYAGKKCEIGDTIYCNTNGTSANDSHWNVLQVNIDGAVIGPSSSTDSHVAVFNGNSGKVIKDSGFTIGKSVPSDAKFTDTTYTGENGVSVSGTKISNSGVRSVASGSANGTISVNTNGQSADVPVKGLGSAAFTESSDYAAPGHLNTYYVKGTQTAVTGAWTGELPEVDALYDGLTIDYWLPFAGSGNATLNLTLKGGTKTGAKNCYRDNANRLTTQVGANCICRLIYQTVTISGTSYSGWWLVRTLDNNTTDIVNLYEGSAAFAAKSAVYRYQLLFQTDANILTPLNNADNNTGTGKTMLTGVDFMPFGKIYYYNSTTNIAANGNMTTALYYHRNGVDLRYTFNCGQTLTANRDFYLKCAKQSNGMFRIVSGTCWTQTLPTSNDGYYYLLLGRTYSTYQFELYTEHPIYYHDGTELRRYIDPAGAVTFAQLTGNPTDNSALNTALAGKAAASHNHDSAYAAKSHTHDDRYYTESEMNTKFAAKQDTLTFDSAPTAGSANPVTSGGVKTALDGKAAASHSHSDYTNISVLPNDNGDIKTKFRASVKGNTGSGNPEWYYKLAQLPASNTGNYASLIISGRLGGWLNGNMSYFQGLVWNRDGTGIACLDIAAGATSEAGFFNVADIVVYKDDDTSVETVYVKCKGYFTFDLDLELFQSSASILFDGTYTTSPTGTLAAQASTSTKRLSMVNGKLLINGVSSSLEGHNHDGAYADKSHNHDERYYTETETNTLLAAKQDKLTFDTTPTASSMNPVTSGGVKTALDAKQDTLTFDTTPTANSTKPVTSGGVKTALDGKQDKLTFDSTPTASSTNPVTSGGVKTALDGKANSSHNHDDRYYTESEMNTKLAAKQDKLENSGWVSVSTTNCSAGSIHYRKIGSAVQVVGTGLKLSSALGAGGNVTVGTLPSTVRPQSYNAYSFGCAGTANPMFVNFETGGAIRFYTPSYMTSIKTTDVCYFNATFLVA